MRSRDRWTVVLVSFLAGVAGGLGGRWVTTSALRMGLDVLEDEVENLKERLRTRNVYGATSARLTKAQAEAEALAQVAALAQAQRGGQRRRVRFPGREQHQDEAKQEQLDVEDGAETDEG